MNVKEVIYKDQFYSIKMYIEQSITVADMFSE